MLHNQDWSATDFETLAPDSIPVTAYKPQGDSTRYNASYTRWTLPDGTTTSARDHYRVAWRCMAANGNERTLIPAVIPPKASHVDGIFSAGFADHVATDLVLVAGVLGSLVCDFMTRAAPKAHIRSPSIERLPHPGLEAGLSNALLLRTLRLNAVTEAYGSLWSECFDVSFMFDKWTAGLDWINRPSLGDVSREWSAATPLRRASDRRQALVEIDALVGLMLGITADELCIIYRTQFAVLYGYDHNTYFYDANGRLVPNSVLTVWRRKGETISEDERTATNQAGNTYTYELPVVTLDREADMRTAYAEFQRRLAEGS